MPYEPDLHACGTTMSMAASCSKYTATCYGLYINLEGIKLAEL